MSSGRKNFVRAMHDNFGVKPTRVEALNATNVLYYERKLRDRIKARFEVKCPDEWNIDYLLDCLLEGYFVVTDSPLGVLPFKASISGTNVFLRPTHVEIINPALITTLVRTLGKDAVLVYLNNDSDMRGVQNMIDKYAYQLASCDGAIDVNLINSKVPFVFECADGKQANDAKKLYDKISRGEPAVFYRASSSALGDDGRMQFYPLPVRNSFIVADIQDAKRTIINEFLTDIGINCTNVDKKERVNTIEATANNEEIVNAVDYWRRNLKECSEKVRSMFGIDFDISLKEYKQEGEAIDINRHMQDGGD